MNSDAIAELRRARDTPSIFLSWTNREQAEWARDVANRLVMTLVGAAPRTIAALGLMRKETGNSDDAAVQRMAEQPMAGARNFFAVTTFANASGQTEHDDHLNR